MRTASEIRIKHEIASIKLRKEIDIFSNTINKDRLFMMFGRTVCARRARKLRKRGVYLKYWGVTVNGKARYKRAMHPLEVTYK